MQASSQLLRAFYIRPLQPSKGLCKSSHGLCCKQSSRGLSHQTLHTPTQPLQGCCMLWIVIQIQRPRDKENEPFPYLYLWADVQAYTCTVHPDTVFPANVHNWFFMFWFCLYRHFRKLRVYVSHVACIAKLMGFLIKILFTCMYVLKLFS